MEFLLNDDPIIIDRHTEPKLWDVPQGTPMPPKHEEVTITINLIGSGDTRQFTDEMLLAEIAKRLRIINAT